MTVHYVDGYVLSISTDLETLRLKASRYLRSRRGCTSVQVILHKNCKLVEPARIASLKIKMLPHHISIICTRPLGRIDSVALKRWALFTVE
jgi:hypothetical protein